MPDIRASQCPHVADGKPIGAYVLIEAPNGQARYGATSEQIDSNARSEPGVHGSFVCALCKHALLHQLYSKLGAVPRP